MVQTKKFEQSFVNEYLAWNLHDQDVLKKGKEEGRDTEKVETALRMQAKGFSVDMIAELTNLSIEKIKNLLSIK